MKRAISVVLTSLLLLLIQSSPAYDLIRISLGAKPDLLLENGCPHRGSHQRKHAQGCERRPIYY